MVEFNLDVWQKSVLSHINGPNTGTMICKPSKLLQALCQSASIVITNANLRLVVSATQLPLVLFSWCKSYLTVLSHWKGSQVNFAPAELSQWELHSGNNQSEVTNVNTLKISPLWTDITILVNNVWCQLFGICDTHDFIGILWRKQTNICWNVIPFVIILHGLQRFPIHSCIATKKVGVPTSFATTNCTSSRQWRIAMNVAAFYRENYLHIHVHFVHTLLTFGFFIFNFYTVMNWCFLS